VDVNPFGPVQEYVAPAIVVANRLTVAVPVQTGPLFVAVTPHPQGLTTIVAVAEVDEGHKGFPVEELTV
jgi:hypothetical protein